MSSPLLVIFTTVLVDLIGFGMVIPLVSIYGRHYGASSLELALLGSIYSLMQFGFSPFWGALSDRWGRRPIMLISLAGSTVSYVIFGLSPSIEWLLISRAFGGIFAANISAAQAYIADVTTPQDRAKGMGLIGAAFGIGFTLGPPLGGISSAHLGLAAPGLIAAGICGINFLIAIFRLKESLPPEARAAARATSKRSLLPLNPVALQAAVQSPALFVLFVIFFFSTFAFSMMEQTFSLLFQARFELDTSTSGLKAGLVLMWAGILGALIQGGLTRKLTPRFGERRLLLTGLALYVVGMAIFPFGPTYATYYALVIPIAIGSSLINPNLSALISRNAQATNQGAVLGLSQGLGSLARATGPFCGLMAFSHWIPLPYILSAGISLMLLLLYRAAR